MGRIDLKNLKSKLSTWLKSFFRNLHCCIFFLFLYQSTPCHQTPPSSGWCTTVDNANKLRQSGRLRAGRMEAGQDFSLNTARYQSDRESEEAATAHKRRWRGVVLPKCGTVSPFRIRRPGVIRFTDWYPLLPTSSASQPLTTSLSDILLQERLQVWNMQQSVKLLIPKMTVFQNKLVKSPMIIICYIATTSFKSISALFGLTILRYTQIWTSEWYLGLLKLNGHWKFTGWYLLGRFCQHKHGDPIVI